MILGALPKDTYRARKKQQMNKEMREGGVQAGILVGLAAKC